MNTYPDNFAPFTLGVTSGDPTSSQVIIWTRIESNVAEQVAWEISKDSLFNLVEQSGVFSTDSQRDWTVKVDVENLESDTYYYYRFKSQLGEFSAVGRAKTAPINDYGHSRIAIMSCSSIFSGYFNAYQRVAERKDLDLIIHVGDYIYDFVDPDEEVRIPSPYPIDPTTLEEWRARHRYYLLDPNLRAARKSHSWIVLWDNHDVDGQPGHEFAPIQAFMEYIPVRLPSPNDSTLIYRKIAYGSLMDIFVTDVLIYKSQDTLSDGTISMIGNAQYDWLTQNLTASNAKWKLLPMQNLMAGWSVQNVPSFVGIGQNGVLDPSNWDGYDADRDRLLNFISSNNIDNVVVLSGDSHVSIVADLTTDPQNNSVYNSQTGQGSVAVEFLPTSITRGNFDEMGFGWAIGIVTPIMEAENPNHVFMNLVDHGYGLLDVKPDSCVAELWYSPILNVSNNEEFERGYIVKDGENHWRRNPTSQPTPDKSTELVEVTMNQEISLKVHPNPTKGSLTILSKPATDIRRIFLIDELGSQIEVNKINSDGEKFTIDLKEMQLKSGLYILCFQSEKSIHKTKIILK